MEDFVFRVIESLEDIKNREIISSAISSVLADECLREDIVSKQIVSDLYKYLAEDKEGIVHSEFFEELLKVYKGKENRFYNIVNKGTVSNTLLKELIINIIDTKAKVQGINPNVNDGRLENVNVRKSFIDNMSSDIAFKNRVLSIVLDSAPSALIDNDDIEGSLIMYINMTK